MTSTFVRGLEVELEPRGGGPAIRTRVRSVAPVRGGLRVSFDRVEDRNASEALVGATVFVDRSRLESLDEGEFLDSDLLGLEVVTGGGASLGRIREIIPTGANDVYAVEAADGSEILVPAVAHAILAVDLDAGRVTVAADALEYGQAPAEKASGKPEASSK